MVKVKIDERAEQRILAAAKIFLSKGLMVHACRTLRDEAGINKALLHYYFREQRQTIRNNFYGGSEALLAKGFRDL